MDMISDNNKNELINSSIQYIIMGQTLADA